MADAFKYKKVAGGTRDKHFGSTEERKFQKTMKHNAESSGVFKDYLQSRGKRGYSKKTWDKHLRKLRKSEGTKLSKTSKKRIDAYMKAYAKQEKAMERAAKSEASSEAAKKGSASRSGGAKINREELRNQFSSGYGSDDRFSKPIREGLGGMRTQGNRSMMRPKTPPRGLSNLGRRPPQI